jgi:hypothetical protein
MIYVQSDKAPVASWLSLSESFRFFHQNDMLHGIVAPVLPAMPVGAAHGQHISTHTCTPSPIATARLAATATPAIGMHAHAAVIAIEYIYISTATCGSLHTQPPAWSPAYLHTSTAACRHSHLPGLQLICMRLQHPAGTATYLVCSLSATRRASSMLTTSGGMSSP